MSQKKKRLSASQQKMEAARDRNAFLAYMKAFMDKAVGPDIYPLLPAEELQRLYDQRSFPVRVVLAEGLGMDKRLMAEIKQSVLNLFKKKVIPLDIGELTAVTTDVYFSTITTLMMYATGIHHYPFPQSETVAQAMQPFADIMQHPSYMAAMKEAIYTMFSISVAYGDLTKRRWILRMDLRIDKTEQRSGYYMEIDSAPPLVTQVTIENTVRSIYAVGWYIPGLLSTEWKQGQVPSDAVGRQPGQSLPVYIQSHALTRLSERLDGVHDGPLHVDIYHSFEQLHTCRNRYGQLLFEYRLWGRKAGYFTGIVLDDKVVLTTFLFLTNNDTPEGDLLNRNTRLTKADKAYLDIDKLSSFVFSDIHQNERVKQIFIEAGCESLFLIDKTVYLQQKNERTMAQEIERYLELNEAN